VNKIPPNFDTLSATSVEVVELQRANSCKHKSPIFCDSF